MKRLIITISIYFACIVVTVSQNMGVSSISFTPQSPVHIYRTSDGFQLQLSNPTTTNAAGRGLLIQALGNDFSIINNENGFIRFHTNNLERMRITAGGFVGINNTVPTHQLTIQGPIETVRLIGPNALGHGARLNFGDGNYVYLEEDLDDRLHIWASGRTAIMGGFTGIGTLTPGQRLHVSENAQVDGYLRVGNAPVPSTLPSNSAVPLFRWTQQDGLNAMLQSGGCGPAQWAFIVSGLNSNYRWDNTGTRSYTPMLTPWIWIPSNANGFRVELSFNDNLNNSVFESRHDGVYIEYTTNGATWTFLNNWAFQGYNRTIDGSNTACSGSSSTSAWNGCGDYAPLSNVIAVSGTWVRFRLVGVENNSGSWGSFDLYGFTVWTSNVGSVGGAYAAGNVYVQNNVYAGSNVLLGDVAEYFTVEGFSKAGYLISANIYKSDSYIVTRTPQDPNVIGVHSTAPTVTLNDPNSGVPVALSGRVPVWVSNENGAIQPGDFLTSSSKPGYAMKATNSCYVIGQALEFASSDENLIICLIKHGWYDQQTESVLSSGNYIAPAYSKEIVIKNPSITENSMVLISMLADPGCNYWVSDVNNNSFTLSFASDLQNDLSFDYMIENAQNSNNNSNVENIIPDEKIISLPFDDSPLPPATPENKKNAYVWQNGALKLTYDNRF